MGRSRGKMARLRNWVCRVCYQSDCWAFLICPVVNPQILSSCATMLENNLLWFLHGSGYRIKVLLDTYLFKKMCEQQKYHRSKM